MNTQYTILMATMGMDIGGAETHILELSIELRRMGFRVLVASRGGVYVDQLEAAGIRHYKLPLHNRKPKNMLASYRGLRRIIIDEKVDIVHGHARIPSFLCGLLHRRLHFPFITTAHWVFKTDGILRYITNWGQKTIAVSNDIKTYLIENYQLPERDISVTINGIDTAKFSEAIDASDVAREFSLAEGMTRIVYCSRMDEDRSLVAFQLVKLAPRLSREIENLEIVVVGGGNSFQRLQTLADSVNNQVGRQIVKLTGARTDVNKFVKTGDIFIGVSRAALEAMAAAKPVIVAGNEGYIGIYDEDKLADCIRTNFTCRDCKEPTEDLLHNDIVQLLRDSDDDRRAALGNYSRQTILERYSVTRMAKDCICAYEALLREKKRQNDVLISGYYGFKNNGDDALLSAIIDNLHAVMPEMKVCVLSYRPKETKAVYHVESVNRFNIFQILHAMKGAKLLINGGGSLMQDATSTQSLLYYLSIMQLARRHHMKSMLYANGIGPLIRNGNRRRAAKMLHQLDLITLRDPYSSEELKNLGVYRDDIVLTADPAFNIVPASEAETIKILSAFGLTKTTGLIGIAIRHWKAHSADFEQIIAKTADYLHETLGLTPVFINMQFPVDVKISRSIMQKMRTKAYMIDQSLTETQMLGIISKMDLILGERLHTLIYAAVVSVAFVGIVYDPKIKWFMDYIGQSSYVDLDQLSFKTLIREIRSCLDNRDFIHAHLQEKSEEMKQMAKKTAELAVGLISESGTTV